jgi:hypothetical protein
VSSCRLSFAGWPQVLRLSDWLIRHTFREAFRHPENMKFDKQVLLSLAALCSVTLNADAFVPRATKASGVTLFGARNKLQKAPRAMVTRLYAADDEDEDDDDEQEGPLGKGVDSVSWLPSVAGEKGGEISGAKEVSLCRSLRHVDMNDRSVVHV